MLATRFASAVPICEADALNGRPRSLPKEEKNMCRDRALQISLALTLALPTLLPVNTQTATQDSKNKGKEMSTSRLV